jgi:hypothetical protein
VGKGGKRVLVSLATAATLLGALEVGSRALRPHGARRSLESYRRYLLPGEIRHYEPRAYTVYQARPGYFGNEVGYRDGPLQLLQGRTPGRGPGGLGRGPADRRRSATTGEPAEEPAVARPSRVPPHYPRTPLENLPPSSSAWRCCSSSA